MDDLTLVVIGGGVMGRAIVEGGIRAGAVRADRVVVVEPEDARRAAFEALGVRVAASVGEGLAAGGAGGRRVAGGVGVLVALAVKPQTFAVVANELRVAMEVEEALPGASAEWAESWSVAVVSIMAGVRAATIRDRLGDRARVVRAMPNTPGRVGQGATAVAAGPGATRDDVAAAMRLFGALGPVVVEIDEGLMDACTAVAGSGPAYLFFLAEAMERAAIEVGLDAGIARRVVAQTLKGAVALLDAEGPGTADPAELRAAVTSKGGTTAAAIGSLEKDGVMGAFGRAIAAARDRGRELGAR